METYVKAGISSRFSLSERVPKLSACEHSVHQLGCNALCFETGEAKRAVSEFGSWKLLDFKF